jgi:hypothetical protein
MPGGAIVDTARSERLVANLAVATVTQARGICGMAIFPVVVAARCAAAGCAGPQLPRSVSVRSGHFTGEISRRNARFASFQ